MATVTGLWVHQFESDAPPAYHPSVGEGVVVGFLLTRWEFAAGGETPAGARGSLIRRATQATRRALIYGYLEYPVIQMLSLAEPFKCSDKATFDSIVRSVGDSVRWLSDGSCQAAPRQVQVGAAGAALDA